MSALMILFSLINVDAPGYLRKCEPSVKICHHLSGIVCWCIGGIRRQWDHLPVWANNPVLIQEDRPALISRNGTREYRNWDLRLVRDVGILREYLRDSHSTRIRARCILSVEEERDKVGCSQVLTENIVERNVASWRVLKVCIDDGQSVGAEADQSCATG